MIHAKKHFFKHLRAGGGRGFYCTCCVGKDRKYRKMYVRRHKRSYNAMIAKEVQKELD